MKLDDVLTSKYLKISDFPRPALVTVTQCERANVAQKDEAPEYKLVVHVREFDKGFVVNSTNAKRLFKWLGNDTDEWTGKKFVLFNDEDVEYAGKVTGGLRVREYTPKPSPAANTPIAKVEAMRKASQPESENPAAGVDDDFDSLPF
jgi:hypothetical protein